MQKKNQIRLELKDLKVKSFVTLMEKESARAQGGSAMTICFCTRFNICTNDC